VIVRFSVDGLAFEGRRNVEEIHRDVALETPPHPLLLGPLADGEERGSDGPGHGDAAFPELAIPRHHDADLMAGVLERLRQGSGHIGETAGLDVRGHLGRHEEHFHGRTLRDPHP